MAVSITSIINSAAFVFFAFILGCLILLTPADAIYQCYVTNRWTNVIFIAGAYVVTFLLAILIYASRVYTTRSVLGGIPRAWIPVEKEDVGKSVRRMVVEGLDRSAIIAYQARPRDTSADKHQFSNYTMLLIDPDQPPWGRVAHPGWSSPSSPDLPDLPYRDVIKELPHLIEAKAVSLAPPDPLLSPYSPFDDREPFGEEDVVPDTRVVESLRRPATMGLREYIGHLGGFDLITPPELGAEFLSIYERARFSSRQLEETEFRDLMRIFSKILDGMTALDAQALGDIRGGSSRADTGSLAEYELAYEREDMNAVHSHPDGRHNDSYQPSAASAWEECPLYTTARMAQGRDSPIQTSGNNPEQPASVWTPSTGPLRREPSSRSRSSQGSVIRMASYRTS